MTHYKYPRTPRLPWSQNATSDDKTLANVDHFIGKRVIVTEKMDGENTTMYSDHIHARSLDSGDHPSRHWVKRFWNSINFYIPKGLRVCGENMYAKHSIPYDNLPSYFLGFSVWDQHNYAMSWLNTIEWFKLLGITPVPVLYEGIFEEPTLRNLYHSHMEGYVVRVANSFHYDDFGMKVAKFVRKNHVQTDEHWMYSAIIPNKLTKHI